LRLSRARLGVVFEAVVTLVADGAVVARTGFACCRVEAVWFLGLAGLVRAGGGASTDTGGSAAGL
jgi:hypothetical protein